MVLELVPWDMVLKLVPWGMDHGTNLLPWDMKLISSFVLFLGFPYISPFHNSGWPSVASLGSTFMQQVPNRPQVAPPGATLMPARIQTAPIVPRQPEVSRKGTKGCLCLLVCCCLLIYRLGKLFSRKSQPSSFSGSPPPPCPIGPVHIPPVPADTDMFSPAHRKHPTMPQRVPLPQEPISFQSNQTPPIPPYFHYRGLPVSAPSGPMGESPMNPYFLAGHYIKQVCNCSVYLFVCLFVVYFSRARIRMRKSVNG